MRRFRKRLALGLAAVLAVPALVAGPAAAQDPSDGVDVERAAGQDRFATALEVSQRVFADGSVDTVVLARGDIYPDALTGGPLAAELGGPLLLTRSDGVPTGVLDEIQRLGADTVVVLGGEAAVSGGVVDVLVAAGLDVERVGGADRFATAALIADEVTGDDDVTTAFLTEGVDVDPNRGWPDAVSVGAYAGYLGAPIFLTDTDTMPASTRDGIADAEPGDLVVVGGPAAVSDDTVGAVPEELTEGDDPTTTVRRLAGADRFATSAAVYAESVANGMAVDVRWLASGLDFPDALTAGPSAASEGQPLLLVPGENITASAATVAALTSAYDLVQTFVVVGGAAAVSDTVLAQIAGLYTPNLADAAFCLRVLHNNDGESQLIDAGDGLEDFGGAARFAARLQGEQLAGEGGDDSCGTQAVLTVTSGDNFLAGPEFNAGLANVADGGVLYDSILYDYLSYDAIDLGNHDFDFGPDVTAEFIGGTLDSGVAGADGDDDPTFLSANLDFSGVLSLNAFVPDDLDGSTVVDFDGTQVGVIGLTTPTLRSISSPGDVVVNGLGGDGETDLDAVAAIVAAEVAEVEAAGAEVIVLISHLQGIDEDIALAAVLSDIDVVVAGGGDEILAKPGELLVPGDEAEILGTYPLLAEDADADLVPVVTTAGSYKYVGRLDVRFDDAGDLVAVNPTSRMVRVAAEGQIGGIAPDPFVQANVVDPVEAFVADLDTEVIGTTEIGLDGRRSSVRTQETNLGNLLADALADTASDNAAAFDIDETAPFVAVQNGGGMRNDSVISDGGGDVTTLDTFDVAPFSNFVAVFEGVGEAELDALFEHAYTDVPDQAGKFAQVGNLQVTVDLAAAPGSRVTSITLGNGDPIPAGGVNLATIDFLARGGDDYPFEGLGDFTVVGVSYQQALADFISDADDLNGSITAADYPVVTNPEDGERILFVGG